MTLMQYAKIWIWLLALSPTISITWATEKTPEQRIAKEGVDGGDPAKAIRGMLSTDAIAEWISGLDASNYQTRRESFMQLWQAGKDALPSIQTAMKSPNRQRADAAATLDILIRLNVTSDRPEEAVEFIRQLTSSPELALVSLCQRGFWNVAQELLETNESLRSSLKSSPYAYARLNSLVDEALDQDDPQLSWPIVRQVLPLPQSLWIAQTQGLEPPSTKPENAIHQTWVAVAQGRIDDALNGGAPAAIKAMIALRKFQWQALAQPDIQDSFLGARQSVSRKAAGAVLLEFAGQLAESERIWETILPASSAEAPFTAPAELPAEQTEESQLATDDEATIRSGSALWSRTDPAVLVALEALQNDPTDLERVLLTMIMTGRAQAVQDYLLKNQPSAAWGFCLARGDQDAALQSLGISLESDSSFDEWVASKRDELHRQAASFFASSSELRDTVQLANILLGLGKTEQADALYEALVDVCKASRQNQRVCWTTLIASMNRAEARHRCLQIVKDNYAKMSDEIRSSVFQLLYPQLTVSAAALFSTAPEIPDEKGVMSKWEALEQLWRWNRSKFEPNSTKTLAGWLRRTRKELAESDELNTLHLTELTDLARGLGLQDLAIEFASDSEQGGAELWSKAGSLLVERGAVESAIKFFNAVRRIDGGRQESIIDEANALMLAGQFEEASGLQKSRWLRPMMVHGNPSSWYLVAKRTAEVERYDLALEYIEPTLTYVSVENEDDRAQQALLYTTLLYSEIADGLKDAQRSADSRRALLVSLLPWNSISLSQSFYNSVAAKERLQRAILAARAGDMESFHRHAHVTETLQPQGIDLVEDTYHELIAQGQQDVAEQMFQRFEKRLLEHLKHWPNDATSHNNLAWMYARCDKNLDAALLHAQRAVELSPHSAVLLDTLAEVHFRRKQYSLAISKMQECIALDPRESHLRKQLERFLKEAYESDQ
jgi:hypothetical protein